MNIDLFEIHWREDETIPTVAAIGRVVVAREESDLGTGGLIAPHLRRGPIYVAVLTVGGTNQTVKSASTLRRGDIHWSAKHTKRTFAGGVLARWYVVKYSTNTFEKRYGRKEGCCGATFMDLQTGYSGIGLTHRSSVPFGKNRRQRRNGIDAKRETSVAEH